MVEKVRTQAFLGPALHAPKPDQFEYFDQCLMIVDADGTIQRVATAGQQDFDTLIAQHDQAERLRRLSPGQLFLPGFVDLHVHAPQWPQLGTALDVPLEVWLQRHTFPLEAKYSDPVFAQAQYTDLVATLLANGTTTALYYATIHLPATKLLADICLTAGQRALIGRVAMDDPDQCPDFYRDASALQAVLETRVFVDYVRQMNGNESGRILPVITPRFIPACTDELLRGLGALAQEMDCHIQTHCSESDWEHAFVQARCGVNDTRALDQFGLLSRKTILAHGNFLSDDDLLHISERGSGVAHCPLSNIYFSDAIFPLRKALAMNVHVGLGTDISGGPSPSILDNARQAIHASRLLESGVDPARPNKERGMPDSRINHIQAFWLATAGGGIALDLPIGQFAPGFQFDAIVLEGADAQGNLFLIDQDRPGDILQKIIYGAGRSNIYETWVGGQLVHSA
jgi:guanine deaminase